MLTFIPQFFAIFVSVFVFIAVGYEGMKHEPNNNN